MKTLLIGLGGIGSYLVRELAEAIEKGLIHTEITIADDDLVELKNIRYQNYKIKEIGLTKTEALSRRYGKKATIKTTGRITKAEQLKNYDLIVCCADNTIVRKLIFETCHKEKKDFIDLRTEGRWIMAMQKKELITDLATLNIEDRTNGSCQRGKEVNWANKITAQIGTQMVINWFRKEENQKILMRI